MNPNLLKLLAISLTLAYPFLVYWGLKNFDISEVLPALLLMLALRWAVGSRIADRWAIAVSVAAVLVIALLFDGTLGLKFYPALMNFAFLTLFASSLLYPPTVVERIARLSEPDLPESGVNYTRKVTWVWCVFFALNGTTATLTALFASDEIWLLYNGFIAYILIAILAGSEWLIRQRVRRRA